MAATVDGARPAGGRHRGFVHGNPGGPDELAGAAVFRGDESLGRSSRGARRGAAVCHVRHGPFPAIHALDPGPRRKVPHHGGQAFGLERWRSRHAGRRHRVLQPPKSGWAGCRHPEAEWFQLLGSVGPEPEAAFPIGFETVIRAERTDRLYLFVNDVFGLFHNNQGTAEIRVECLTGELRCR